MDSGERLRASPEKRPSTIHSIQYLRALAALMVVFHHAAGQLGHLNDFGTSGVDLFFVISGFIMVVTTANKELSPGAFLTLRLVRVAPLYWVTTIAMILAAIAAPWAFKSLVWTPVALVKSIAFIPYDSLSFPGSAWPVLVPGWTLNFEMFFYLLFALSLGWAAKYRLIGVAAIIGCFVAIGYAFGPFEGAAQVYTSPRLLEFVAGMVIARYFNSGSTIGADLFAIVIGLCALAQVHSTVCLLLGASMVIAASLNPKLNFHSRPLLALGDASYSIYLTHLFTLGVLRVIWVRLGLGTTSFLVFALPLCALVGYACYRWIEKPMTAWLHGWVRSRELARNARCQKTAVCA